MTTSRGPRRSSECAHSNYTQCRKWDCPSPAHTVVMQSDGTFLTRSCYLAGMYNYKHSDCHNIMLRDGNYARDCACSCHKVTATVYGTSPASVTSGSNTPIVIRKTDYPNVDWMNDVTGGLCHEAAIQGTPLGHTKCKGILRGSNNRPCKCPCHGLTTNMPLTNPNTEKYRNAVAKLAHIYDTIEKEIFLGIKTPFKLVGACVRDALLGGTTDTYHVVMPRINNPDLYVTLWGRHLERFMHVDNAIVLGTPYGNLNITIDSEFDPQWSFDRVTYDTTNGIILNSDNTTATLVRDPASLSYRVTDPSETLKYGLTISAKYNLKVDPASIDWLANRIQALEPPPKVNETLVGFRAYKISDGVLYGQHDAKWESTNLEVDCPDFVQHIKEAPSDWRMARLEGISTHECGIYIIKDPATCLYEVKNIDAMALVWAEGVVGDFDKGYRAQKCEIKKLWVFKNTANGRDETPHLKEGVYDCPIIGPASHSDFLYDPEVMQWAGR